MKEKPISISIFGLGYVGTVTAACLAKNGHHIIGVDKDLNKVTAIGNGDSPIVEPKISDLLISSVENKTLSSTRDATKAINDSEVSIVAVGTPSRKNGSINLKYVESVSEEIGHAIKEKDNYHTIVLRSTVLPESCENVIIPIIESFSEKKAGKDFGFIFNPEFLREGSAVDDFFFPPKTVIGCSNKKDANLIKSLYSFTDAPLFITSFKVAEMVKYADNAFHATKVVFGNEIGSISKAINVDSHQVMEIFCSDTKLNISPNYLKPGYAFGGSCLPKDLRALMHLSKDKNISTPMISSLISSNIAHIDRSYQLIVKLNKKKIGFLGFAFKANTDDLRESPIITLMEMMIEGGYDIKCFDDSVKLSNLTGSNKLSLNEKLPHISKVIVNSQNELIENIDVLVIGNKNKDYLNVIKKIEKNIMVIDLVRIGDDFNNKINYDGICW